MDPRLPRAITRVITTGLLSAALGWASADSSLPPHAPVLLATARAQHPAQATAEPSPAASPTPQPPGYVINATWRSALHGQPLDAWVRPAGVDVDAAGRIYVSDAEEPGLKVIELDGTVRRFGPPPPSASDSGDAGPLVAPGPLAVDSGRGRLYVADPGAGTVVVFDMAGQVVATWGNVPQASGIGVAPDGRVYVAAARTGAVLQFTPDGQQLATWTVVPPPAAGPGPAGDLLAGLEVGQDGRIYVLATATPDLLVVDDQGHVVDKIRLAVQAVDLAIEAAPDGSPSQFWLATGQGFSRQAMGARYAENNPAGPLAAIALAGKPGLVAVAPAQAGLPARVLQYRYGQLTGAPEQAWGRPVDSLGALVSPFALQMGADGWTYVLDAGARVQWWGPTGIPDGQVSLTAPLGADAAPDGTAFVVDDQQLLAFGPPVQGQGGSTRPLLWQRTVAGANGLNGPAGVAYDRFAGQVLVLDADSEVLDRFTAAGDPLTGVRLQRPQSVNPTWADLAADGMGNVVALDRRTPAILWRHADGSQQYLTLDAPAAHVAMGPANDGLVYTLGRDGWVRRYALPDDPAATALGPPEAAFDATRFDVAATSTPADLSVGPGGLVYVADRDAGLVTVFRPDAGAAAQSAPEGSAATCRNYPNKTASPRVILRGETVDVRLTLRGGCGNAISNTPLDVMFILDVSGSMAGQKLRLAQQAAIDFVDQMDMGVTQVGLVSFNTGARTPAQLTHDPARVVRAIRQLRAGGGTAIDQGLLAAARAWAVHGRPGVRAAFVLLSDGYNNAGPNPVLREAKIIKAAGVEIFTVDLQGDARTMLAVATNADHYFRVDNARKLPDVFGAIASTLATTTLYQTITVTDVIPANMRYVPGSALPIAAFDAATNTLNWQLTGVSFLGFGLRYTLQPLAVGDWPTNVVAWGDFLDGLNRTGRVDFPVPRVLVLAPTPVPVVTDTPRPPPTPTQPPTPTATPELRPIYLPILPNDPPCSDTYQYTDVALVIDASTSMLERAANGVTKLDATRAAARLFVGLLSLPNDQASVISFNATATVLQPLTGDRAALEAAIDRIQVAEFTRIDLGLAAGHAELTSPRHQPGHTQTLVLLTDGRSNPVPVQLALDAAAAAKQDGLRVFTIGVGADVDADALRLMASTPTDYFFAPGPEALEGIYRQIAFAVVRCGAVKYWPGRTTLR